MTTHATHTISVSIDCPPALVLAALGLSPSGVERAVESRLDLGVAASVDVWARYSLTQIQPRNHGRRGVSGG